jgi:methanogenic corrinoid protein MtbC1
MIPDYRMLVNQGGMLSKIVIDRIYSIQPYWKKYGEAGRIHCERDTQYHLSYLAEALLVADKQLFMQYLGWVKTLFSGLKLPPDTMDITLRTIREVLLEKVPKEISVEAVAYINEGISYLEVADTAIPSFLAKDNPLYDTANSYVKALLLGKRQEAYGLVMNQVKNVDQVKNLYNHVFQPAQYEIGRLWQANKISVAQEHYCSATTQLIMAQLYPYIFDTKKNGLKMIATCVSGELHEIGIRMVADFFEMEGWDTYYVGANMPANSILETIENTKPDLLCVSITMLFHLSKAVELITSVKAMAAGRETKIMVGGYPFSVSPSLWEKMGSDASANTAQEAIVAAQNLLAGR